MKANCPCPEPQDLERLLSESAAPSAETEIVRHLDSCPDCQQQLEKLAVRESQVAELVEHIDHDRPDSQSAYWPAMDSVRETPSIADVRTEVPSKRSSVRRADDDLSFLTPSDDPAYLGRLGHFEISRLIGRGGMGLVFEAYDSHLQRTVAVKVLDPDLADDELARQRFCREARSAAAITHEHVVTVYQVEKSGDGTLPFLVMQLIHGETLEKKLSRDGRLPLPTILRVGMQVSAGLAAAHSLGMIHRDVKPGNILLEEVGGRVKLTDFGLARCIEDLKITRTGFVAGTPLYMSPEQAMGDKIDERSDLFSLGGVLYEMATGEPPFSGNTPLAVLKQIADGSAKPIRTINPDLPAWLNDLIQKLLSKRPDDRPVSASVVAQLLGEKLSVFEPISPLQIPAVHTSGACETVKRQHRRHRMQSLVLGVAIGGALALGALFPFLGRRNAESSEPVGPEAVATLAGNAGPVWSIALTPDDSRLAMGIDDGTVKLWDVANRRLESTMKVHPGPVWATSISSDGQLLVTGHDDGTVHVWDPKTEKEVSSFNVQGPVRSLEFERQGHRVAVGTRTGQVGVWNADSGAREISMNGHEGIVMDVSFSPDGTLLGSAGGDKTARLWNLENGRERTKLEGHVGGINSISFSADSQLVATGGWDKAVHVWDTASGGLKGTLEGHTADIWAVAFAPTGHLLASASEDKEIRLWDAVQLKAHPKRVGHTSMICTLAFTHDGQLASAGRDGTVRLWDVRDLVSADAAQ
jgi:WD40 repeat protein/serine/threonine protein kinase